VVNIDSVLSAASSLVRRVVHSGLVKTVRAHNETRERLDFELRIGQVSALTLALATLVSKYDMDVENVVQKLRAFVAMQREAKSQPVDGSAVDNVVQLHKRENEHGR